MSEFFRLLRDNVDGKVLLDTESGLYLSDQTDTIQFVNIEPFPTNYLRIRDPYSVKAFTTPDAVTGVDSASFWGNLKFSGREDVTREDVALEMRKEVYQSFLKWFNSGGNILEFVWARLEDGFPVRAYVDSGALKSAQLVPDGTGEWFVVTFTLILQDIFEEDATPPRDVDYFYVIAKGRSSIGEDEAIHPGLYLLNAEDNRIAKIVDIQNFSEPDEQYATLIGEPTGIAAIGDSIYVVGKGSGATNPGLLKINPVSGAITRVNETTDNFGITSFLYGHTKAEPGCLGVYNNELYMADSASRRIYKLHTTSANNTLNGLLAANGISFNTPPQMSGSQALFDAGIGNRSVVTEDRICSIVSFNNYFLFSSISETLVESRNIQKGVDEEESRNTDVNYKFVSETVFNTLPANTNQLSQRNRENAFLTIGDEEPVVFLGSSAKEDSDALYAVSVLSENGREDLRVLDVRGGNPRIYVESAAISNFGGSLPIGVNGIAPVPRSA